MFIGGRGRFRPMAAIGAAAEPTAGSGYVLACYPDPAALRSSYIKGKGHHTALCA